MGKAVGVGVVERPQARLRISATPARCPVMRYEGRDVKKSRFFSLHPERIEVS